MRRWALVGALLAGCGGTLQPAFAQVRVGSWPTELGAGIALDAAARGPWIAPAWRQSFAGRVVLAVSASVIWDFLVEPWNGYGHAASATDVGQRLVGTLAFEGLVAVGRRIFR